MTDNDAQDGPSEMKRRMEAALKRNKKLAPNPHQEFLDKGGKGGKGPRPSAPKARNFRHQGR